MRLQKRLSRITVKKTYYKWIVTIPPQVVKDSGFKEGQEIEAEPHKGRIILRKK